MSTGVALGLWLALRPFAARVLEPYVKIFNAMPRVVLAPIFALWFGLGLASKVALVITLIFFIAFFNTYQGVREVNPVVLANARLLRASGPKMLRHIYIPSAIGWIMSSLRVSIGLAITGAVVGEYLGSTTGIGNLIARAESIFDAVGVFAGMVVLGILVVILDKLVDLAERKLIKWRPAPAATTME
jgi:NitT/TauT family transport system permease protein